MILFILKIISCSAIFIGFYLLILQREKMFQFNRLYLLVTLVLSFAIPFMELGIQEFNNPVESVISQELTVSPHQKETLPAIQETQMHLNPEIYASQEYYRISLGTILTFGFLLITTILFVKFIYNVLKLNWLAIKNEKEKRNGYVLVKVKNKISPFSFLTYLFVNKEEYENQKIAQEIFHHEHAHIAQKHSWDVLFMEFLFVFNWFNPFIFLYRKAIKTNHEFLADDAVLNQEFDRINYQQLLIKHVSVPTDSTLSSPFNYLVTKKRLIMMNKKSSQMKTLTLKFLSIPFLVLVMLIFSEKVSAQVQTGKGISKELYREYKKQIRKATVKVKNADGSKTEKIDVSQLDENLMKSIYNKMSDEQKLSVTPIPSSKEKSIIIGDGKIVEGEDWDDILAYGMDASDLDLRISDEVIANLDFDKITKGIDAADLIIDYEDLNIDKLSKKFDSKEFQDKIKKIEFDANKLEEYYDSPKWKERVKKLKSVTDDLENKMNSPEWQLKLKNLEFDADKLEKMMNSKEWKEKWEKLEKTNKNLEDYMKSPAFKKRIQELKEEQEKKAKNKT